MITLVTRPPVAGETSAAPAPIQQAGDVEMHAMLSPALRAFVACTLGREPTESEMVVHHFHDVMEDDAFRAVVVPEDLYCLSPGCGRKRVEKGACMGALTDYDVPAAPTGCAPFIWHIHVAAKPGAPAFPCVFLGATCPDSRRCSVRASASLDAWLLEEPLRPFGPRGDKNICVACYANIAPPSVPCTDACGKAYYCSAKCREAHAETHAQQRAHDAGLEAKRRTCAACGRSDYALRKCGRCRAVYYCDAACQLTHWREGDHQSVCKGHH